MLHNIGNCGFGSGFVQYNLRIISRNMIMWQILDMVQEQKPDLDQIAFGQKLIAKRFLQVDLNDLTCQHRNRVVILFFIIHDIRTQTGRIGDRQKICG